MRPMSTPDEHIGALVHGRYRLQRVLGRGGMATVYAAWDDRLSVARAVKMLHAELARDEEGRQRFEREARIMARLRHPHIATVHDAGVAAGQPFLVMDLFEAGSLAASVPPRQGMAPQRALQILLEVLDALRYAHAEGVIHRDIRPENVLLDERGRALVADFGLASLAHDERQLTCDGALLGTPAYMAPEVRADARQASAASDLYAAGITLFVCLTGQPPWALDGPGEEGPILAGLPRPIQGLIQRATAADPADRYATAEQMAQAMGAARRALEPREEPPPEQPAPSVGAPAAGATGVAGPSLAMGKPRRIRAFSTGLLLAAPLLVTGWWAWSGRAGLPGEDLVWVAIPGTGFALSEAEVTVRQFRACVEAGACTEPGPCHWGAPAWGQASQPDAPMNCVERQQAAAYAAWVGGRLPSDEEWVRAVGEVPEGQEPAPESLGEIAWYLGNSTGGAHPPCRRARDTRGLCDLRGNLWEWTATDQGVLGVIRGGSWDSDARTVHAAGARQIPVGARYDSVGFRVARDRR
ncbi:MAG: bifunctional serine/threonine-protein kinase/formylglycine-generating enzyme family protein [Pseudomonadota bacterium]